ncbi:MAG: tripartite tricarboxylate transporter substrate binding protein [Betaproteobacteria bacterium]|nr:tripartite tricarboxylate transporter substrate binding protein [Betaproteobacteria bacterium]
MIRFLAFALIFIFSHSIKAQEYPVRPVTVIIPFSSGSASDVIARIVLERMSASVGQRFVVDNRPAAGGTVGTIVAMKAEPDGYTLVMGASGPLVVNKALNPKLAYDPEKDFDPISLYASMPNVVTVSARLPVNTLPELTDYVRRNANVPYSSVGNGSSQHLAGVFFTQLTGTQMQHVPYRITSQLQADLISGQVPVSFQLLPNVLGAIKGGHARPLAVASNKRLPALPDVPTAAEAGVKGYESAAWFGFVAPRGTLRPVIDRLNREIIAATADPAVRARLTDFGAEPLASTPEEFGRFISTEMVKWREIITKGNITLE